jgi:hypothetical protein
LPIHEGGDIASSSTTFATPLEALEHRELRNSAASTSTIDSYSYIKQEKIEPTIKIDFERQHERSTVGDQEEHQSGYAASSKDKIRT